MPSKPKGRGKIVIEDDCCWQCGRQKILIFTDPARNESGVAVRIERCPKCISTGTPGKGSGVDRKPRRKPKITYRLFVRKVVACREDSGDNSFEDVAKMIEDWISIME